ncbi:MAG: hypothetical protein AB1434_04925 [Pseudomonadota bacterium]
MLESEKLAIAAHLHVLLRRKTGRVTDTEWMVRNTEYATEIARFARQRAREDAAPELAQWADKLEAAMGLQRAATPAPTATAPSTATSLDAPAPGHVPGAPPVAADAPSRYLGRLR